MRHSTGLAKEKRMPTYVMERNPIIAEQWSEVVAQGAGRDMWVMDTIEKQIKETAMPGVVCEQMKVTMGSVFGKKRDLLRVTFANLTEYRMFIGGASV
jgi:DNA-binding protein